MKAYKFINLEKALGEIREYKDPPVLALGIFFSAGLIFLVGSPKSGKTTFLEHLSYNLICGIGSFMGMETAKEVKVIAIINLEENFLSRTRRNYKQIANLDKSYNKDKLANLFVLSQGSNPFISTDEEWSLLIDSINNIKPEIIIIDSLARLYLGSIENSSEAQLILKRLRYLVETFNVPVIVLHHTIKLPPNQTITLNNVAGSRLIGSEADFVLGLGKTSAGLRYIKPLAYRYSNDDWETLPVFQINENGLIEYLGQKSEADLFNEYGGPVVDNQSIINEYIKNNCKATTAELIKELVDSGKISRSSLFSNLNSLVRNGSLIKLESGFYKHAECHNLELRLENTTETYNTVPIEDNDIENELINNKTIVYGN